MSSLDSLLRSLRQHLGARAELMATVALGLVGVGGLSFTLITHTGTPAGAALAYVAAVNRADTDYVWTHSIVNAVNQSSPNVTFLDRAALDAQLKATAHSRSAIGVQNVAFTASGTRVVLSYNTPSGPATTSLIMRGGAPHSWPVLINAAGLDVAIPPAAGAFALDGRAVEVSGLELKLAVFPGDHQLSLGGSDLYQPTAENVGVNALFPAVTPVTFAKIQLTDKALSEAKEAVAAAIQNCIGATALMPNGCPQSYTSDVASGSASWSSLGDQIASLTARVNEKGRLEADGHYLMKLGYTSTSHVARVVAVGGPFAAQLKWDGQTLSVEGFNKPAASPALARPTAGDAEVIAALQAQFNHCLSLQAGSAPDCPQSVAAYYASNFVWHAMVDPTQGATVSWDGAEGFFKVTGNFDFSVDYDSTPPLSPTRHYQDHSSGQYTADLYWDGSKAVFIGFE